MTMNIEILKKLLREADEEVKKPEEKPEEEVSKSPFEEDPMGFILKKYVTLKDLLEELMTPSFEEYLNAIFIVAPKPTTFKVLLHNGQYFFLTYLDKVYQATIGGKNYYLLGIGEKQLAMQAIARLLRFGTPLKTQGPEGAEQGTEVADGGEELSGEPSGGETGGGGGGTSDGGEFGALGAEAGAAANPPGVTPKKKSELAESNIISRLISEAENKKKVENLFSVLKNSFDSLGFKGKKDSKHGPHLRYAIGSEEDTLSAIQNALNSLNNTKFYKIEVIDANSFGSGAKSGKYKTYKITTTKDLPNIPKGQEAFVVNQYTESSTIVAKALTPTNLKITEKVFKDSESIIDAVNKSLYSLKNENLRALLSELMKDVANGTKPKFENVDSIIGYNQSIPLSENTTSAMSSFSDSDINVIGKDFGEILGSITMGKIVDSLAIGVKFPKGGNNPLADFTIDGYNISSKYAGGASATLTAIINEIKPKEQLTTKYQKELYKVLKIAVDNTVSSGYIEIAKFLDTKGINALAKAMGLSKDEINPQSINDIVAKTIASAKSDEEKTALLFKKFRSFYDAIGRSPKASAKVAVDWNKLNSKKLYGVILGPLSYSVADELNANAQYVKSLSEILSKIEVKQIYLTFSLKSKSARFIVKPFSDPSSKFKFDIGSQSVYHPENSRLAFKMTK
jgi:hypothetical protein